MNGLSIHLDGAQGYADSAHPEFEKTGASYYLAVLEGQSDMISARQAAIT